MRRLGAAVLWSSLALMVGVAGPAPAQTPTDSTGVATPQPPPPPAPPTGPDFPRGRISGLVFGDYFWNATGDPRHLYSATGADSGKFSIDNSGNSILTPKPITRDLNGIQIRRIYFQLDNDLSVRFATRLRLEADGKAFSSDGKISSFVKNAYIQAKNVYPRGDVFFGMINTPIWEVEEEFWGYRSIEKTILDFRGLGSSSDLGVGLKGYADAAHHLGYSLMVGDGNGQKPEDNRYKKFYLALPFRWTDFIVEPYSDYENGARGTDRATYKLFAGVQPPHLAIGVVAADRVNHGPAGNLEQRGFSAFARWSPRPTLGAFARFDQWEPNHRAPNRVDSQLWMIGVDWQPITDVHVIPNLEGQHYDAKGTAAAPSDDDLQARITVYYRFSRPQS